MKSWNSAQCPLSGNKLAALIAEKIGEDPTPYREEADKILKALNTSLWLPERGHWAEFQDFMGHRRLHEDAAVWTIYHALDSDVADPFQAYLATSYIDREIPHIPVVTSDDVLAADAALPVNAGPYAHWQEQLKTAGATVNAAIIIGRAVRNGATVKYSASLAQMQA